MKRIIIALLSLLLLMSTAACSVKSSSEPESRAPSTAIETHRTKKGAVEFYDGTTVDKTDLASGVGYQFQEFDIVAPFTMDWESGYNGRHTVINYGERLTTFGQLLDAYGDTIAPDQQIGVDEYVEMLGFSAVCTTETTSPAETAENFSRSDVIIEDAESFDIIYWLKQPTINDKPTTDLTAMLETLGKPRFAAVGFPSETEYRVMYFWDLGDDHFMTILNTGAVKIMNRENLLHYRPMFAEFFR